MHSSAPAQPDFWTAFQQYGPTGAPAYAWHTAAGISFPILAPFLIPFPGPLAGSLPCPRCGRARDVTNPRTGIFIMEKPDDCGLCEPDRRIKEADVVRCALDLAKLVPAAAHALGVAAIHSSARHHKSDVMPLGTILHGAETLPVAILFARSLAKLNMDAAFPTPERRVLLHFQPEAALAAALHQRRFILLHLPSMLVPLQNGAFRAVATIPDTLNADAGSRVATPRPPVPLTGRRFEISPNYDGVRELTGKRQTYEISNLQTRCALQALVESGADSESHALTKADFCRQVHRLSGKMTPMPKEMSPTQFFRHRTPKGTKHYPFYASLIGKNGSGGRYWLKT